MLEKTDGMMLDEAHITRVDHTGELPSQIPKNARGKDGNSRIDEVRDNSGSSDVVKIDDPISLDPDRSDLDMHGFSLLAGLSFKF